MPGEPPPPAPGFDTRGFTALAGLCALAAPAALPYQLALLAQLPPGAAPGVAPAIVAVAQIGGTLLVVLPLAALGLALQQPGGGGVPLLAALAARRPPAIRVRSALLPGFGVGLAVGALLLLGGALAEPWVARRMVELGLPLPHHPPAWTGVLASFGAGVIEETAFRLFLLSAVAAGLARAFRTSAWHPAAFLPANLLAALAFGALHFLNVAALRMPLSATVVLAVLAGNGILGLAAGALFKARGLEAAMACHAAADLVLHGLGPAAGWVR